MESISDSIFVKNFSKNSSFKNVGIHEDLINIRVTGKKSLQNDKIFLLKSIFLSKLKQS